MPPRPLPIVLVVGNDAQAVRDRGAAIVASQGRATVLPTRPAREWPFRRPLEDRAPDGPTVFWAEDAQHAFDTRQPPHTRLVTTQAQYLFTEWAAWLAAHGAATLVATVNTDEARAYVPDLLQRRGIFAHVEVHDVDGATPTSTTPNAAIPAAFQPVDEGSQPERCAAALREPTAADRLRACIDALAPRTAPALLATASVCQEVNDLEGAARDLDEAIALAPDWAAAHFERGKVWLRLDDMAAAARCFRAATERLPAFGGAWGNLGATLGELDRPADALVAFERLLALDALSPQAHNNIGVLTREMGRLPDSEAAFRRVIELEPTLAFGYYNLGHTLFLQGRYRAAATAYAQGQSRDPDRNPVQATRLALCWLASGDAAGALAELQRASSALPREYRRQVLSDTSAVLWALISQTPDLQGWHGVHEWVTGELSRLA